MVPLPFLGLEIPAYFRFVKLTQPKNQQLFQNLQDVGVVLPAQGKFAANKRIQDPGINGGEEVLQVQIDFIVVFPGLAVLGKKVVRRRHIFLVLVLPGTEQVLAVIGDNIPVEIGGQQPAQFGGEQLSLGADIVHQDLQHSDHRNLIV